MNKFRATPQIVDGVRFASKKEAKVCAELKLRQRLGEIRNLTFHPKFTLTVNGSKICDYFADAAYFEGNSRIVIDVKSKPTKTPVYRLKRKLLLALNPGIDHREV